MPGISREAANEVLAARDDIASARNPANASRGAVLNGQQNEPATARFNTARATRITTSD